jgi:Concanavalin A-like lectin/glucanases superfamily
MKTAHKTMLLALTCASLTSWTTIAQEKNGLVAHWSFDEKQGEIVKDSSGNGYNGKIVKAKRVKGIKGNALEFNGIDSYVKCPAKDNKLNMVKAITIIAWIKLPVSDENKALGLPTGIAASHQMIVSKASPAWYFSCSKQKPFFSPWIKGKQTYYPGKKVVSADEWHQVACSWDAATGQYRTYLDGKMDVNIIRRGNALGNNKNDLIIGAYTVKNHFLKGIIDEIMIYNKALTPQEIAANYKKYARE